MQSHSAEGSEVVLRFWPCAMNYRLASVVLAGGLPFGRDFHRQNKRKPFRCQRMSVSDFTTTSASFQSNSLLRVAIVNIESDVHEIRGQAQEKISDLRQETMPTGPARNG
jgi:hypothetical protein